VSIIAALPLEAARPTGRFQLQSRDSQCTSLPNSPKRMAELLKMQQFFLARCSGERVPMSP